MITTRQVPVFSCANILIRSYYFRKLSVNCVCWTVAIKFSVFCYMLQAKLFPEHQLINHGEHFVSIMKHLSSALVCVSQITQSASTIITIDSGE
jgi:hypothetical protein